MWNYNEPPTIGEKEIIWYQVLLNDGTTDKACWWCNHWYCYANWYNIVAWKEE